MKYADLTSSTSHVEISAILQNKCPTLTHIIYTVQEVLCKMFKTLLSYAPFIRVLQMQFSFPRSPRSKRFRAGLTEILATRATASKVVELLRDT